MKMKSVRPPPVSWSSTTGVLVGNDTRTAARSHLHHDRNPTLRRGPARAHRGDAEGVEVAGHDPVEVPVPLVEVESVTQDELVGDLEPDEAHGRRHDAADRLVEQGAHLERTRLSPAQLPEDVGER